MDNIWKKWFCLECWSINFWDRKKSWLLAKESIINFLKVTWNIEWKAKIYKIKKEIIKMDYMYKTKTTNFSLKKEYKDFEELKAWEVIAYDWKDELIVENDSIILFAYNQKEIWKDWFCIWHKII
jgi:hypothetical protein